MVNWYYVIGSERVGPVSVEALKQLFLNNEITEDSYVWKKGFANWERLKDVSELKFEKVEAEPTPVVTPTPAPTPIAVAPVTKPTVKAAPVEVSSPEIKFSFDWNKIKEQEEIFFIKIGKDRKTISASDIFGPYTAVELKEAMSEKRINLQTLVFAPGMTSWTRIEDTILNDKFRAGHSTTLELAEVPMMLVIEHSPQPLITMIKKAGVKEGILLGAGPFTQYENATVKATLYVGNEVKVKNVQLQVQNYDKKSQAIECRFVELDADARMIMLNHAV